MSEFQNPQNQPGIDKRVMVVFAATMVLLVLAQQFLVKPQQQENQQQQAAKSAPAPVVCRRATPSLSTVPAAEAATTPVAAVKAESEKHHGGGKRSLPHHLHQPRRIGEELDTEEVQGRAGATAGVGARAGGGAIWLPSFAVDRWDQPMREKLNSALYVASGSGSAGPVKDLSFEYADGDLVVKKQFHFDNTYVDRREDQRAPGREAT